MATLSNMRSETPANPLARVGTNPHQFRDAMSRGKIQGKLAASGKRWSRCPYSPDSATLIRKRAVITVSRSNKNRSAWVAGFEATAGFKYK